MPPEPTIDPFDPFDESPDEFARRVTYDDRARLRADLAALPRADLERRAYHALVAVQTHQEHIERQRRVILGMVERERTARRQAQDGMAKLRAENRALAAEIAELRGALALATQSWKTYQVLAQAAPHLARYRSDRARLAQQKIRPVVFPRFRQPSGLHA